MFYCRGEAQSFSPNSTILAFAKLVIYSKRTRSRWRYVMTAKKILLSTSINLCAFHNCISAKLKQSREHLIKGQAFVFSHTSESSFPAIPFYSSKCRIYFIRIQQNFSDEWPVVLFRIRGSYEFINLSFFVDFLSPSRLILRRISMNIGGHLLPEPLQLIIHSYSATRRYKSCGGEKASCADSVVK